MLHDDVQDTETEAWARVLENIDSARRTGASRLVPLEGLSWEQRSQIVTLPASIASLSEVKSIHLYRSNLVRLPPEIGEMPSLACLDVYTSYRLHFAPLELAHCRSLEETVVRTRTLYGNYKNRAPFPLLGSADNEAALALVTPAACSVCRSPFTERGMLRRWITLYVGSDEWPLLVHACSEACLDRLPTPNRAYVDRPHEGGAHGWYSPPKR